MLQRSSSVRYVGVPSEQYYQLKDNLAISNGRTQSSRSVVPASSSSCWCFKASSSVYTKSRTMNLISGDVIRHNRMGRRSLRFLALVFPAFLRELVPDSLEYYHGEE